MRFNLDDYETVESRIKRFYEANPDGRIETNWESSYAVDGAGPNIWVIKAFVFLTAGDQANKLPKATGYAFEKDGTGGANNTSALENAETSAIGRALANMNLSGNKRASREEMQKVANSQRDFLAEAEQTLSIEALRNIYAEAKAANVPADVLDKIRDYGQILSAGSEDQGTGGRVSASPKGRRPGGR